jgi:hypothetical protein
MATAGVVGVVGVVVGGVPRVSAEPIEPVEPEGAIVPVDGDPLVDGVAGVPDDGFVLVYDGDGEPAPAPAGVGLTSSSFLQPTAASNANR